MATGRYTSDLEEGDVLEPVVYQLTPFIVREYCHGVEEDLELFHAAVNGRDGTQYMVPTLTHIEKIRLLNRNCPDGAGPSARIHFEYHARHHAPVVVGTRLRVSGHVSRRYPKRGRDYLEIEMEVRDDATDELYTSYRDTVVLSYRKDQA